MRLFVLNITLALIWVFLQGSLLGRNFLIGFILGYVIIALIEHSLGRHRYARKVAEVVRFFVFVIRETVSASVGLAWLTISPNPKLHPAIISIPLDVTTDAEITLLANLITLSPGTLALDISSDRKLLYVHTIQLTNPDDFRRSIKNGLEKRVLEVMR